MKKLAILLAWENFSSYYSEQLANAVSGEYETFITHDNSIDFSDFDVVVSFFPQRNPITNKNNVIKLFWEPHELGWEKANINVGCSVMIYRKLNFQDCKSMYAPLGVNTDHFNYQDFPDGKIVVGWAGAYTNPRKRFKETSECINSIPGVDFRPNLVEAGEGKCVGPIKNTKDMAQYYKTIHIYVCGSANEGFGLPLLEAAACGRPIITFNVGVAAELSRDGAGIIFVNDFQEMRERVEELSKDIDKIKKLGEMSANAIRVGKWMWKDIAPCWIKIFKEIEKL